MSWTCPTCGRSFRHTNQVHSCATRDLEEHFERKEPHVRAIYDLLISRILAFGDVRINPVKNAILVQSQSTFLAIKPKKEWLDIEFLLNTELRDFPIYKSVQASKARFAHFVRLEEPAEVDSQLLRWLKRAYRITSA